MAQVPTLLKVGSLKSPPGLDDVVPIEYIVAWTKKNMPEFGGHEAQSGNRILIVLSRTGTGKSTVLPVYLFRILRSEKTSINVPYKGPSVLCTQPRVLTAIDIATNQIAGASYLPDMRLGITVGYSTGSFTDKPPAGLVFATIGVLDAQLRTMEDAEIMSLYRFIIIDEAHERSIASDSTLMRLKNFYDRNIGNKKLPFLFLASATFDTELYAKYFGVGKDNIVYVEGRAFPIYDHFAEAGTNNFPKDSALKAIEIHEANLEDTSDKADILVFLPGAQEIKLAREILETKINEYKDGKGIPPFLILAIDRDAIQEESQDFYLISRDPSKLPYVNERKVLRRVILSTVIAETGLTLPNLKYVIDTGWNRENVSYQPQGVGGLITLPAPQSRILQRKGRAGRKFPGEFYPVYTENVFNSLLPQQLPEVITSGVNDLIIGLVSEQQAQKQRLGKTPEFLVEDIDMLGSPPAIALLSALGTANALGFVSRNARLPDDSVGFGLTEFGQIAARFARTSMEKIRMILAGRVWGANLIDLVTIAAVMDSPIRKRLMNRMKPGKDADAKYYAIVNDAFPPFLHHVTGGSAEVAPPTTLEMAYMRIRLLVADDFIEALLVVDKFIGRLETADGDVQKVIDVNESLGLNSAALFDVLAKRDEIIEDLFVAGIFSLEPAPKLSATKSADFMARVIAIKRCLYDGFRAKVMTYDEKGNVYVDRLGTRAEVPPLLSDLEMKKLEKAAGRASPTFAKPKYILTNFLELAKAPKDKTGNTPMVYSIKTRMVSVLDGYIEVDPDFVEPEMYFDDTKQNIVVSETKNNADAKQLLGSYLKICRAISPKCPPIALNNEITSLYSGKRRTDFITNVFVDCRAQQTS